MIVSSIIKSAMRKIGAVAAGEDLNPDEQQDGLDSLQSMLRSWSAEKLNVFSTTTETFVLTPPTYLYTWGSGGNITTSRPHKIIKATITDSSGVTHPVDIIGEDRYMQITVKATTGRPYALFPKYNYPLVQVYLYPIPETADTLNLNSLKQFTETSSFDSWDDELQMPVNYEEPIIYNLAIRLAPEYGTNVSPEVIAVARSSYERLFNLNVSNYVEPVSVVVPASGQRGGYSINSDGYR